MDVNKQMSAVSNLNNDLINEVRYKVLCKLYSKYKSTIKTILENANEKHIADDKMNELNSILEEIENYSISWNYYKRQPTQFSADFENLIIFCNE